MKRRICLNADLGELPGAAGRALDEALLALVSRCNIACGGHAGDAATMAATVAAACRHGVRIGAHPSYPDRAGFGRRRPDVDEATLAASLAAQVAALAAVAAAQQAPLRHLKAHGALYNDAAADPALAGLVARTAVAAGIAELLGPPGSALADAADRTGLRFVAEGFADRAYLADGRLAPRDTPGAVFGQPGQVVAQALSLLRSGQVETRDGLRIDLPVRTLCLHGDTPAALALARALRAALAEAGVEVRADD